MNQQSPPRSPPFTLLVASLVALAFTSCQVQSRNARLEAPSEYAGASIYVDNEPAGELNDQGSAFVLIPSGLHLIRIEKHGYEPIEIPADPSKSDLYISALDRHVKPAEVPSPRREPADYRLLEVTWSYGHAAFRECKLILVLHSYGRPASSQLTCISHRDGNGRVEANHDLTPDQTEHLWDLVEAANLFGPGQVGRDTREGDGTFTVLTVSKPGEATALVISKNPTFESPGPRKDLSDWMAAHHHDLWEAWRTSHATHGP